MRNVFYADLGWNCSTDKAEESQQNLWSLEAVEAKLPVEALAVQLSVHVSQNRFLEQVIYVV